MSQQALRFNLGAANIPFLSQFSGRGIILPQYDQNYDRSVLSTADTDKDKGIPQIFYCHNVIPTGSGVQSIGYDQIADPIAGETSFNDCFVLRDAAENKAFFSPALGKNYVLDIFDSAWRSSNPISGITPSILITHAYINGQTFIYYEHIGCFTYDSATRSIIPVTLTGLLPNKINGITSASGYMIAWDDATIYWSSNTNPIDFVPSLITGAGSEALQEAKGQIRFCVPIFGGFLIYTMANVVSATASGNSRFPFVFKEVAGSQGVHEQDKVSYSSNLATQYVISTAGIQALDRTNATGVFPEVSDFLAAEIMEDLDTHSSSLELQTVKLADQLLVAVTVVGARWLVFSYGVAEYTHALLYDLTLKRWGKLRITHVTCFDAIPIGVEDIGIKNQLAFLQKDGTVKVVDFALTHLADDAAVIIGKFQFNRTRLFTLQGYEIEKVAEVGTFSAYSMISLDGKKLQAPVPMYLLSSLEGNYIYRARQTGVNISILNIGTFALSNGIVNWTVHGRR